MSTTIATERATVQRLRARDERVLGLLLAGRPLAEVAAELHVNRATLWRIRSRPEFQAAFTEARGELLAAVVDKLRTDAADYASTLHGIATDTKGRGSDRVLASRHGLDLMLRGVETLDLADRIAKLEQVAGQGGQG
jgi:hypothetical protein